MQYSKLKSIITCSDRLKEIASLHHQVVHGDLAFDADMAGVSDEVWDKAISAARSEMIAGVEADYHQAMEALGKLGVTDIPAITEWPTPEKPLQARRRWITTTTLR